MTKSKYLKGTKKKTPVTRAFAHHRGSFIYPKHQIGVVFWGVAALINLKAEVATVLVPQGDLDAVRRGSPVPFRSVLRQF